MIILSLSPYYVTITPTNESDICDTDRDMWLVYGTHWWEFLWRNSFITICLRIYHLYIEWSYFYGEFYGLDRFKIFFLYAERKFENVNWKHLTIFISVFINNVQNPPFLCSKKCLIFVYLSVYKTTSSNTYSHSSVHHSKKVWMMCKCVKHWHGDYTCSVEVCFFQTHVTSRGKVLHHPPWIN